MSKVSIDKLVLQEVKVSTWPLLPSERNWGTLGLIGVMLSSGVAAWSYMIGGYVAWYLGATLGTIAMIAGSLVAMFFVVLATVPPSVRYGIDSITASKPQFGTRGAYFTIFLQYASIIGWNCLLLILLGRAVGRVLVATGLAGEASMPVISVTASLSAIFISWLLLRQGADAIRSYSTVIAVGVTTLGVFIFFRLVTGYGFATIFAAPALAPSGDTLWDYTTGFEILVASVLSWWPYMGTICRMSSTARKAAWPAMICMGLPTGVISLIGLYSALVTGDPDPTAYFLQIGGLYLGIVALLFLALANIGTAIVGAYCAGIGLKQIPYIQSKLNWSNTSLVVLLPVAVIAALIPNLFFDGIGTFMAFLGVFFAPLCGIQIVDYFLLRKQRLNIQGLYDSSSSSPYHFIAGFNPAAVAAVVAGFFTYVYLLNPVTYISSGPYKFISASIPALVVSGVVYYIVTKLFAGTKMGDYDSAADGKKSA